MKKFAKILFWLELGLGLTFTPLLHGQRTFTIATNLTLQDVAVAAAAATQADPVPATNVSPVGMFYSAQDISLPPVPGNFYNMAVWPLGDNCFLLDDLAGDVQAASSPGDRVKDDGGPPGPGDGGGGTNGNGYNNGLSYTFSTNGLWMQIVGITNGLAYLNLENATDQVYEVWSSESLTNPLANWSIEQEVWPITNQSVTPFTAEIGTRTNNLFFFARDWTGITSGGNTTPEWWFWNYFGTTNLSDSDLDGVGNTLSFDYQNGFDPNVIYFGLNVTNRYANSGGAAIQISVSFGVPYYMSTLVDSPNYSAAHWVPFNSNLVVNLGSVEGWHTVWVGLKGLAPNGQQTWNQTELKLVLNPPLLIVTDPVPGIVTEPFIQLQGYCPESLASISYDLGNSNGFATGQPVLLTTGMFDTNNLEYTNTGFECFNVPLAEGTNTITLHATDLAGNATATNLIYVYDPDANTNPPAINILWPQNNTPISGTSFPVNGAVDDPFATMSVQIVNADGTTNIGGLVEQNGLAWFQNLPLASGTNYLTVSATNAAGYGSTTNIVVTQSAVGLTITSVTFNDPASPTATVTGALSSGSGPVFVNGVQATNNGDGTWTASFVPVGDSGTAVVTAEAMGGGGGGGAQAMAAAAVTQDIVRGPEVRLDSCHRQVSQSASIPAAPFCPAWTDNLNGTLNWTYGASGGDSYTETATQAQYNTGDGGGGYSGSIDNQTQWDANGNGTINNLETTTSYPEFVPITSTQTNDVSGFIDPLDNDLQSFFPVDNYFAGGEANWETSSWTDSGILVNFGPDGYLPWEGEATYQQQERFVLTTGGQATVPGQNNLYVVEAWAESFPAGFCDLVGDLGPNADIPANQITVNGQTLDANHYAYILAPNNSPPIDVTPQASANCVFDVGFVGEYQPQILANGVPLDPVKTNATFCVGQQVSFTFRLVAPAGGNTFSIGSNVIYNWTLPSPAEYVSSVTTNSAGCPIYGNNSGLLSSNAPGCWYIGGNGGKVTVGVSFQLPNGRYATVAALGQFAIYRPTFQFISGPSPFVTNAVVDGTLSLSLGDGSSGDMEFQILVDTDFQGHVGVVQLINANRVSGSGFNSTTTTEGGFWLDKNFPYGGPPGFLVQSNNEIPLQFADGPFVGLLQPTATVYDQFQDYVIFSPTGAGNIFVTLGLLHGATGANSWSWNASTSYSTSTGTWSTAAGIVISPSTQDATDAFPLWTNIFNP